MSRAPDHTTFVAGLRREVSAYADFIDLLHQEQACLTTADMDPLAQLARKKEDKVEELNALARLRCAFLESHALPATQPGMQQWISTQGDAQASELRDLWEQLAQGAAEAKRLNRSNGLLINNRMTFNREALNALNGLTRSPGVYGRDGFTAVGVTHRTFGAA